MSGMRAYSVLQGGKCAVYEVVLQIAEVASHELYAKSEADNVLSRGTGAGFSGVACRQARNGEFF